MPFYDVRCRNCDHRFTIPMSVDQQERDEYDCPDCGSRDLDTLQERVEVLATGEPER